MAKIDEDPYTSEPKRDTVCLYHTWNTPTNSSYGYVFRNDFGFARDLVLRRLGGEDLGPLKSHFADFVEQFTLAGCDDRRTACYLC